MFMLINNTAVHQICSVNLFVKGQGKFFLEFSVIFLVLVDLK